MDQNTLNHLLADPDALATEAAREEGPERSFRIHVRRTPEDAVSSFVVRMTGPALAL